MTKKQIAIWDYLATNALGSNNAKKMEVVATAIGEPPYGTNNDNVRSWINEMVVKHSKQIGTFEEGVFIILTDEEREMAAKFLERNSRANAVRINGNYIP